jgi:cellulose synthase/poly-beta-1,6-N-acetylglucosamine synthase-like glycosyltransferase
MSLLNQLPDPGPKTGWPWTQESAAGPSGKAFPRITIITPSYNQGSYIEETLRSILLQNYPNLQYIVMDGGSNDSTLEVLEREG